MPEKMDLFNPEFEPTDEQLAEVMAAASRDARASGERAARALQEQMRRDFREIGGHSLEPSVWRNE